MLDNNNKASRQNSVSSFEQDKIESVYGSRFSKSRAPKSGETLKASAIEKFKSLSNRDL